MKNITIYILVSSFVIFAYSCKYQKLLKSSDSELKYTKAKEYYDKKDFARAMSLYEQLIPVYRGTVKGEEVAYLFAYCQFFQKDYITAAYRFRRFAVSYPNSKHAKECSFMSAYCSYLMAPKPSLDQEYTRKAIREFGLYVGRYPDDERVKECNKLIDELRSKLETKSYDNAMMYYKMGHYQAATIALENSLEDYPDTKYKENILFYVAKAHYKFATMSIHTKQRERLENALRAYKKFNRTFPESKYKKEMTRIYEHIKSKLENFS